MNATNPSRAAFLDRDGTLNVHNGYILRPDQIELIPGAAEAVRLLNAHGILAIVTTNQSAISRGLCSEAEMDRIHAALKDALQQHGAHLDAIYLCPHHPDFQYRGICPEFQKACDCRKPQPGMLLRAAVDWNLDLPRSAMFGDAESDVEAALRAGVRPYLLSDRPATQTDSTPAPNPPTRLARNLHEAVRDWLLMP